MHKAGKINSNTSAPFTAISLVAARRPSAKLTRLTTAAAMPTASSCCRRSSSSQRAMYRIIAHTTTASGSNGSNTTMTFSHGSSTREYIGQTYSISTMYTTNVGNSTRTYQRSTLRMRSLSTALDEYVSSTRPTHNTTNARPCTTKLRNISSTATPPRYSTQLDSQTLQRCHLGHSFILSIGTLLPRFAADMCVVSS